MSRPLETRAAAITPIPCGRHTSRQMRALTASRLTCVKTGAQAGGSWKSEAPLTSGCGVPLTGVQLSAVAPGAEEIDDGVHGP